MDYYDPMKPFQCFAALMALALNAAAQVPAAPATSPPGPRPSALDAALFYEVLLGELSLGAGDPGAGYSLMLDAARKTHDAALFQRAVEIALQSRSGDGALQAARAWQQDQPASRDANRYLLQILVALNRIADTGEPLRAMIAATPAQERSTALAGLPRLYTRTQEKVLAARVVEQALADAARHPLTAAAAWTANGRMRLQAGDPTGALEAAQKAQAIDPQADAPVWLALEMLDGSHPLAEPVVHKYLEGTPRPEVRLAYARVLLDLGRQADALRQLRRITTDTPDLASAWLLLGSLQVQDRQAAEAEKSLHRFLTLAEQQPPSEELQRGRTQAYLALAQLAEQQRNFAAAEAWLNRIENADELVRTQSLRASILAQQGRLDQARQLLQALPARNAEETRLKLMAEVQLLRDNKQPRLAYDLLGEALDRNPGDADLLYERALLAEKIGLFDEMERLLRQLIATKPESQHAYNALGYSLADRNVRLTEARELIRKALALTPNDPFIQDSLGWAEFRLGNSAEALRIFEAAYQAKPDAEIAAHFGEVLWSQGQRERATKIWREGLLLNPENETLTQTLQRLQVRP